MENTIYGIVWVYRDNEEEFDPDNIEVIPGCADLDQAHAYCERNSHYEMLPRVVKLRVIGLV